MTYAALSDLQGSLAYLTIGASSVPTSTQVGVILDDISDEIDTVLAGQGMAPPITAPDYFVGRLKRLNVYGAAAAVLKSFFPEARGQGENPAYAFWEARYRDGLKALRSGADIPSSITESKANLQPSGYFTRNPDAEEVLGSLAGDSMFKVGQQF